MKLFIKALQSMIVLCIISLLLFQCQSVPDEAGNSTVRRRRKKRKPKVGSDLNTAEMYPGLSDETIETLPKSICRKLAHIGLTYDQELELINAYKSIYSTYEKEEIDRLKEERKKYKRGSVEYRRLTDEINQISRMNRLNRRNNPLSGNFYSKLREILTEEQYRLYRSTR